MPRKPIFPQVMQLTTLVMFLATLIFVLLHRTLQAGWILSAAISAGTTFYHFAMRLLVGFVVPPCIKNPMKNRWFAQRDFDAKLYKTLRVKSWKGHMPTYDPASFSLRENSLEQIVHNSCVSEAVHEVIIVLSFVPLLFAIRWGEMPVFLITSLLAALFDSCFVIMQRYNRPRLLRILSKKEA